MPEENIEVRDLRHQEWLWTSKTFLFHPNVDEKMYKVYSGLAAYANNQTQQAFPSIGTLMQNLHMGRNTVLRAIKKLEEGGFVSVARDKGANNIYSLLEFSQQQKSISNVKSEILEKPTVMRPNEVQSFFKGIQDLKNHTLETPEKTNVVEFLNQLVARYPKAGKAMIWGEVLKFEQYWTEMNTTGTKERWQKEPTFQVDRRLVTWFAKKKEFAVVSNIIGKGNKQIV